MLQRLFRKNRGDTYIRIVSHLEVLIASSDELAIPGYLRDMRTPDILLAIQMLDGRLLDRPAAGSDPDSTEAARFGLVVDTKARAALARELKLRGASDLLPS